MDGPDTAVGGSLLRRLPKQERSRERVDEILAVAMRLIGEKGIDAVTMKEVAQHSGGPIASVYQYFPNKSAIIATLYARYNRQIGILISECLIEINSLARLHRAVDQMLTRYNRMMRENPPLLDLVNAVHADKKLQNQDLEETEKLVSEFFEASVHLFPEAARPQYRRTLFLLFQLASSTVRMSFAMEGRDGEAMLQEFANVVHLQIDRIAAPADGRPR
ncbi:TetR/AcrR family transcriptional regulator [Gellertiella hungarica]|uniref:AcrR family transcriptional regulator n=1 Tax=Gellertiella hungarica TaxID=1572859 RepID=A0A7W6J3N5_9HYPH|nr:TetR/AcrR family transcriptional regulator [Gellertiella hungarica]MBB4064196.1 AcrR family transcriptional regulator [Gellertiella hungarica]